MANYLYLRTSEFELSGQDESGSDSLDVKLEQEQQALRQYCVERNWELADFIVDHSMAWNTDFSQRLEAGKLLEVKFPFFLFRRMAFQTEAFQQRPNVPFVLCAKHIECDGFFTDQEGRTAENCQRKENQGRGPAEHDPGNTLLHRLSAPQRAVLFLLLINVRFHAGNSARW